MSCSRSVALLGVARARAVLDVVHGPTELLDPAVGPHPLGVVERAVAVGPLLGHHDDRELLEAQRHVQPPEAAAAGRRRRCGRARRRRRPAGCPTSGRGSRARSTDRPRWWSPSTRTSPVQVPELREPGALQDGAEPVVDDVWFLLDRGERTLPREVESDAVVVAVADHAHALAAARAPRCGTDRPAGACGRCRARRRSARCARCRRPSPSRTRRPRRGWRRCRAR